MVVYCVKRKYLLIVCIPAELKVIVISLINIHIIDLLRDTRLSLASELSAVLMSYDESALDSIVQVTIQVLYTSLLRITHT